MTDKLAIPADALPGYKARQDRARIGVLDADDEIVKKKTSESAERPVDWNDPGLARQRAEYARIAVLDPAKQRLLALDKANDSGALNQAYSQDASARMDAEKQLRQVADDEDMIGPVRSEAYRLLSGFEYLGSVVYGVFDGGMSLGQESYADLRKAIEKDHNNDDAWYGLGTTALALDKLFFVSHSIVESKLHVKTRNLLHESTAGLARFPDDVDCQVLLAAILKYLETNRALDGSEKALQKIVEARLTTWRTNPTKKDALAAAEKLTQKFIDP